MIYLDNAATTLRKPPCVLQAVQRGMLECANPGRGGHRAARRAEEAVYRARVLAGKYFAIPPQRVCFTMNATHALNIAIRSVVPRGGRVVISGLEHNAVLRPLTALEARLTIVKAPLFSRDAWLEAFDKAVDPQTDAVVCLQVSNVFGCVLPVERIGALCRQRGVPLIVDASQSAGVLPVKMDRLGAAFAAMPGHKGLLGPQGTGLLLCGAEPKPLLFGGTGSNSASRQMPDFLPDLLEAGTLNVPGICGLAAALGYLSERAQETALTRERLLTRRLVSGLKAAGAEVWAGEDQLGVVSFRVPGEDPEQTALRFDAAGVALRAGLHCAPLAHETAGTAPTGTVRASVGLMTTRRETERFLRLAADGGRFPADSQ